MPQYSVFWPFLFLLYINDLQYVNQECQLDLYLDDISNCLPMKKMLSEGKNFLIEFLNGFMKKNSIKLVGGEKFHRLAKSMTVIYWQLLFWNVSNTALLLVQYWQKIEVSWTYKNNLIEINKVLWCYQPNRTQLLPKITDNALPLAR